MLKILDEMDAEGINVEDSQMQRIILSLVHGGQEQHADKVRKTRITAPEWIVMEIRGYGFF